MRLNSNSRKGRGIAAALVDLQPAIGVVQRIATGDTVEPVPPWIFSGCMANANS
jgi:hypothetical protein